MKHTCWRNGLFANGNPFLATRLGAPIPWRGDLGSISTCICMYVCMYVCIYIYIYIYIYSLQAETPSPQVCTYTTYMSTHSMHTQLCSHCKQGRHLHKYAHTHNTHTHTHNTTYTSTHSMHTHLHLHSRQRRHFRSRDAISTGMHTHAHAHAHTQHTCQHTSCTHTSIFIVVKGAISPLWRFISLTKCGLFLPSPRLGGGTPYILT